MKKKQKKLTSKQKIRHPLKVQSKVETVVIPILTADENNARIDRVFGRLYKLRGSDLKGLADEIENEEPIAHRDCNAQYLFHVTPSRIVPSSDEGSD